MSSPTTEKAQSRYSSSLIKRRIRRTTELGQCQSVLFETPLSKWVRRQSVCQHSKTITERMPGGHLHYGAERCANCGRHLRWLPRPETLARQKLNGFRLVKLGMCDRLTSWERSFVADVSQRKRISPKQQALVDRLVSQYVEPAK